MILEKVQAALLANKNQSNIKRLRQERGWKLWLISKPFDWVTTPIYLGALILFFLLYFFPDVGGKSYDWWNALLVVSTIVGLMVLDRLEFWAFGENISVPVAYLLLTVRIVVIQLVTSFSGYDFSDILYLIMPLSSALYLGMRAAYLVSGLIWLIFFVRALLSYAPNSTTPSTVWENLLLNSIILVFVLALAKVVTEEKKMRRRAEQLLDELAMSHRQVAELATIEERSRLARDIHDSLGHYLTVVNIQLEKALTFRDSKPEEAEKAVRDAKRLANNALEEVRRSVSALRTTHETFSLHPALAELVENTQNSQLMVELTISGNEESYPLPHLMTLYRASQESLTNIQKHARANQAEIQLDLGIYEARLIICDNGRGFDPENLQPRRNGGGYGLSGLRERLELVGGSLKLESKPNQGTRLCFVIPKYSPNLQNSLLTQAVEG